jgi:hypothetical protein
VTDRPLLALVAFLALTLVLAFDFNASALYREAHGIAVTAPRADGGSVERVLATAYHVLLDPLDRAVRALAGRRFAPGRTYGARTVTVLANMGLTTQLAVLGVCLLLGAPAAYLWFVLVCFAALVPMQLRAERRG